MTCDARLLAPLAALTLVVGNEARAGDVVFPDVGVQPLSEGGTALLDALTTLCGATLSSSADSPGATRFEMDSCDVVVDVDRGVLHVDPLISRTWSYSKSSVDEVADRQVADVALLESFGFDLAEFGWVRTLEFAGQDRDEETGLVDAPRYMGTKTIIDRELLGVLVLGNRVVVTRDAAGSVARITAAWSALDSAMEVDASSTVDLTEDDAATFTASPILDVQRVMLLADPVDGLVSSARICTEVTRLVSSGDGDTKPSAIYIMDGKVFDPTEDW